MRDVDGKAWIVSARTSIGTRALIARTHSWIAAEASGQAIAAPTSSRVARSTTIVTWPNFGLDGVALGALREVGDELERVEAGLARLRRASARPTPPRGPCTSHAAARGSRARSPRRAPSGPRARPGSGAWWVCSSGRPGRRSPTARRRCAAGRRAGTASGRSCRCRSARDRGRRAGKARPTASRIAWPSAVEPSSRSMTCAPSVPAPARAAQRPDAGPDDHPVALERARGAPRSCAGGRSGRAADRTGRSSSGRRTGRRPGRARSRSGRHRGRAGCAAARGRASPRGSSRSGSRRGRRSAAPSTTDPTATTTFVAVEVVRRRRRGRTSTAPRPMIAPLPR